MLKEINSKFDTIEERRDELEERCEEITQNARQDPEMEHLKQRRGEVKDRVIKPNFNSVRILRGKKKE